MLFGAHQFLIHPWFVAFAWWRLYGLPLDPRLWLAFFVHDLGYIGKPNMDGPEGESHPEWGARLMGRLFGSEWHDLVLLHSRFYSKRRGLPMSRLGIADKLALCYTPTWVFVPLATLSGEVWEYIGHPKYQEEGRQARTPAQLHHEVQEYCRAWVAEHRDGRADGWTLSGRQP